MKKKFLAIFVLVSVVVSIVYLLSVLGKNTVPFQIVSILEPNHPERLAYEKFEREFSFDNEVYLSFPLENLKKTRSISKEVYAKFINFDGVSHVVTPENFEVLRYKKNSFKLESVESNLFKERNHQLYRWNLFSKKENFALIKIIFHKNTPLKVEKKTIKKIVEYIDGLELKYQVPIYRIGTKIAIHYLTKDVFKTQKYITPILLLIISLGVLWLFRKLSLIFIFNYSLFVIYGLTVASVLIVEGGHTPFSSLVLLFSLVVSTSDLIHYFCAYEKFNGDRKKIRESVFVPCLLTTITTGGAFLSLTISEFIPVVRFGLLCCIASILAFIVVFYLLPIILDIFIQPSSVVFKSKNRFDERKYYQIIKKHSGVIIVGSFAFLISMIIFYPKLELDDNFYEKFVPEHKLSVSINHFRDHYSYIGSLDITYESSGQDFEEIEKSLNKIDGVVAVKSLFTFRSYLKEIIPNDPDGKKLKSLMKLGIDRNIFEELYNKSSQQYRMMLFVDSYSGQKIRSIMNEASLLLSEKQVKHSSVGFINIRELLYSKILDEFLMSFGITLLIIFICFIFLFKSFWWGLIAMVPNIVPILFIPFAMNLSGIKIENNIAILVCITIGIAVDDTIHFLYQLKKKLKTDGLFGAIILGSQNSSKALIGTTFLMSLSFSCFLFGDLNLTRQIGVFIILSFGLALIADLVLIPAILFFLQKIPYFEKNLIRP